MTFDNQIDCNQVKELANVIRKKVIEISHQANASHLGSALSCIDLLTVLYSQVLKIDKNNLFDENNDKFILSKGHAAAAIYTTLAYHGFFPIEKLVDFGNEGGKLAEHPGPFCVPGIEIATGSLGHGLPIGSGMALAGKIKNKNYQVYVLMSDGECNEGSVWEAALFAASKKLNNLNVIIDYNKWQATGRSNEVMALHPLKEKWQAFGWEAHEINGHDQEQILKILNAPRDNTKPRVIVANTIKGKGVSFMEDDNNWHYRVPTAEEVKKAHDEIDEK